MTLEKWLYQVQAVLNVTKQELLTIRDCCLVHYDGVVHNASQHGGFVYGWLNLIGDDTHAEIVCTFYQLDTCAKALEIDATPDLRNKVMDLIRQMNAAYRKANHVDD